MRRLCKAGVLVVGLMGGMLGCLRSTPPQPSPASSAGTASSPPGGLPPAVPGAGVPGDAVPGSTGFVPPSTAAPGAPVGSAATAGAPTAGSSLQGAPTAGAPTAGAPTAGTPGALPPGSVPAQVGVGAKGRSLDPYQGVVVTPAKTLFAARERVVFDIQIPQALQLYKASNGQPPASHDEFMQRVIAENNIQLPVLPAGKRYQYDPATEQLMVAPSAP